MPRFFGLVLAVFLIILAIFINLVIVPNPVLAAPVQAGTATPPPASSGEQPLVFADVTTNCREGPSTAYKVVGWLVKGDSTTIHGRDEGRHWWYVQNPTRDGYCWVWAHSTYTNGNIGAVQVVTPPPKPEQKDNDQWCALTLCFHGEDDAVYCYCRPVQKSPPQHTCYNYGCPSYPWWR